MVIQTTTPYHLLLNPNKDTLRNEFLGKLVDIVRTPALVIDRDVFAQNCAQMHRRALEWGASFRAHLKTHKTSEGTRLQLVSEGGRSDAVVVSTLLEAWAVVNNGLVEDGTIKDIADLGKLLQEVERHGAVLRLLIDHQDQIKHLEEFEKKHGLYRTWSVFVKVHGGQNRAGVRPESPEFLDLIKRLIRSPVISIHGFYGHAGNSYASTSLSQASSFLSDEVRTVNRAAEIALNEISAFAGAIRCTQPFILSVGSTPTAHAASTESKQLLSQALHGKLELHAGNYPMLDLQQQHTTLITAPRIAQRVRATVISYYPGRGTSGEDEALVDAGATAFSKDTGPSGGYGEVVGKSWRLTRISQEHGILIQTKRESEKLEIGTVVEIIGQHACLIAAVRDWNDNGLRDWLKLSEQGYPWYYIVDRTVNEGKEIVDIWVPWKGW